MTAARVEHKALDAYVQDPVGHWTSGEGWLHACTPDAKLSAAVVWGGFGADPCRDLIKCVVAALDKLPSHARLVDGRRGSVREPVVFRIVGEYIVRHREALRDRVTKVAIVRPPGLSGAAVEGFFAVVTPPYPVDVFDERGEALRAIECEAHVALLEELEELAGKREAPSFVSGFRRAMEDSLLDGKPAALAKKFGLSVRSLQRRLQAEGTSFQRELAIVRVRVAQNKMLETDMPLAKIAAEVGFASPAAFSLVFRRHEGMTPSEWRDAHPR